MSERDAPKTRLDRRIDAALASWPNRKVEESAWEAMADRIEEHLVAAGLPVRGGSSDDDILKAPLPATPQEMQESASLAPPTPIPAPGERSMSSSMPPSERDRDRRSLKDLAKLAASPSLTPGPPSSKGSLAPPPFGTPGDSGDSGIVDLKKITEFSPGALGHSQGAATPPPPPPMASTRPAPAIAPPPFSSMPPAPQYAAPPPVPFAPPVASQAPYAARPMLADEANPFGRKKRSGLAWTVGIGAIVAAAAAAFLVLRSQPTPLIVDNTPPPPAVTAPPPPPAPEPVASAAASASAAPPPEAVAKVDTPAPAEPAAEPGRAAQKASAASASGPKRSAGSAPAAKAAAPPVNPALVAKNVPASTPQSGSLSDALRQAAGPMDAPAAAGPSTPSAPIDTGSNVPQRPSSGAIASGVGSSLTQARACLSSGNPVSHANITFDSSGSVTNVSITGFAAGQPAEGCIKAALRRAKVPAFAQPTYTTGVTVRPN